MIQSISPEPLPSKSNEHDLHLLHLQHFAEHNYEPVSKLGRGSFSCVYQVRRQNEIRAVKIIEKRLFALPSSDGALQVDHNSCEQSKNGLSSLKKSERWRQSTLNQTSCQLDQQQENHPTEQKNHHKNSGILLSNQDKNEQEDSCILSQKSKKPSQFQPTERLAPVKAKYLQAELVATQRLLHSYHPNIVRVYNVQQTLLYVYIYMEHVTRGTIQEFLMQTKMPVDSRLASGWIGQLASALHYLHIDLGLAHRDLKLHNVGLDKYLTVKLFDFGFAFRYVINRCSYTQTLSCYKSNKLSKTIPQTSDVNLIDPQTSNPSVQRFLNMARSTCGTPFYMSPEVIVADEDLPYDPSKADLWSLGVCMYVMLTLRYPFNSENYEHLYRQQIRGWWIRKRVYSCLNVNAFHLLQRLLHPLPKKRYTAKEIMKHNFVKESNADLIKLSILIDEQKQHSKNSFSAQ